MENVLAIFPSRGLDNSILVPIYIGLLFHAFFIETIGWSGAGLVVTGYLASVFAIAPQAGLVITAEIVVTYAVVNFISETLSRLGWWHSFFGRERYLIFFVVSLLVRLVFEVWLLQSLAGVAVQFFGIPLEAASHLYGIGLVIVPLTAHALWKPGFVRGVVQIALPTAMTYAVLVFVLEPFTNFSIANFELTFQDLALDFASSPKIYITLILGMMIAARFNLKLGWDFNGIMIPSLLAVAWYMPWKVLATLVEATLVVIVAYGISLLPIFRRSNLEGMRRLLLIFTVSLGVKYVLGYYYQETDPGFKVSDLFGFGYLLPSLIALNIWDNRSWSLIVGPTLITSFLAFAAGNLVGLVLYKADQVFIEENVKPAGAHSGGVRIPEASIESLRLAAIQTIPVLSEDFSPVSTVNRMRYRNVLSSVIGLAETGSAESLRINESFANDLHRLHLTLTNVRVDSDDIERLIVLREPLSDPIGSLKGWGTLALVPGSCSGVILEVPYPGEEPEAVDAALQLLRSSKVCGLLVNGWRSFRDDERAVLSRSGAPFATAHDLVSKRPIVQVRVSSEEPTTLHVRGRIPPDFDLEGFKKLFPGYRLAWKTHEGRNPAQDRGISEFLEIVLNASDLILLWSLDGKGRPVAESVSGIAFLREHWMLHPDAFAPPLSEAYEAPTALEAEYLTESVLRPLRRLLARSGATDDLSGPLALYRLRASVFGFDLRIFTGGLGGAPEILLYEPEPKNHWGTYLFRTGASRVTLEVPRPLMENGSLPIAMDLYATLGASALYVAGADLEARLDGMADVTTIINPVNPFQAAHRATYARTASEPVPWILQVRGAGAKHELKRDALFSMAVDLPEETPQPPLAKQVMGAMERLGWQVELYDSRISQLGLKGIDNLQLRTSAALDPNTAGILWIAPEKRQMVTGFETWARQLAALRDFGLAVKVTALEEVLPPVGVDPAINAWNDILALLEDFAQTGNVSFLKEAMRLADPINLSLSLIRDTESGKPMLWMGDLATGSACVVRILDPGPKRYIKGSDMDSALLDLRYGRGLSICTGGAP